jgi:hypothetical protein
MGAVVGEVVGHVARHVAGGDDETGVPAEAEAEQAEEAGPDDHADDGRDDETVGVVRELVMNPVDELHLPLPEVALRLVVKEVPMEQVLRERPQRVAAGEGERHERDLQRARQDRVRHRREHEGSEDEERLGRVGTRDPLEEIAVIQTRRVV